MGLVFPREPGTYGLLLQLQESRPIEVGKLGLFMFQAGVYLYVGSALGPGGLAGRLKRHLSKDKRIHWHVDYLSQQAQLKAIWYGMGETRREHDWAMASGGLPGASVPVSGFGTSDCNCQAHLTHFEEPPAFGDFQRLMAKRGIEAKSLQEILIAVQN